MRSETFISKSNSLCCLSSKSDALYFLYSKSDMSENCNSKPNGLSFLYSKSDASKCSSIPNLTGCETFNPKSDELFSESDALFSFPFKNWHVVKFQIKTIHFIENLMCWLFFQYRNSQVVKLWSQNPTRCTVLSSKSDQTKNFPSKIWRVVKPLTQKVTRCFYFISKSGSTEKSVIEKWRVVKVLT